MPTATFANLAEARRRLIIETALDEFAERPYERASLSQIVARAGIAKGSIYQYFADKQDMYLFLLDYAIQQQLQLLTALPPPDPDADMFTLLRWQMSASIRVDRADPRLTRMLYHAMSDNLPFRDEVQRRVQHAGTQHLLLMIQRAIERGEIDPSIDPEIAAFFVRSILGELRTLLAQRLGYALDEAAANASLASGPEAERIFDTIILLLRRALAARAAR